MKSCILISGLLATASCVAQVRVDRPIILTSPDSTQRQVTGLAAPATNDALITLATERSGSVHLAQISGSANAIELALQPTLAQYEDGLLVRFTPTAANTNAVTLNVDGLGSRKLLRPDLLAVSIGELLPGATVEAQYADSVFILLHRAESGCPPGFLPVTAGYCIQSDHDGPYPWFQAAVHCADRGARLCTWDEYYAGCMAWQGTLTELFVDWEWVDDTADHTHTAVQCGRYSCVSQRNVGAVPAETYSTRCCYQKR